MKDYSNYILAVYLFAFLLLGLLYANNFASYKNKLKDFNAKKVKERLVNSF